jgi:hypothetical protein
MYIIFKLTINFLNKIIHKQFLIKIITLSQLKIIILETLFLL